MLELLELKRGSKWISVNIDDDDCDDGEMLFLRRPGNPVLVSIVYYCRYFSRGLCQTLTELHIYDNHVVSG